MADRKQTPDVLAELLGADLPPAQPAAHPRMQQPPRDPAPRARPQQETASDVWEVEIVTFQEHHGWRPRFVNGAEVKGWLDERLIHEYVNQRGAAGWELAGASTASHLYGASDSLQLYFKRRR